MPALTLERLVASLGFGSRKDARNMIRDGIVEVAGEVIDDPSFELETRPETIVVGGEEISTETEIFGIIHKPLAYECSARPQHHESVFSLLPERFVGMDVRCVGRLDVDTSGLLLFSNNGAFIHQMESPKKGLRKRYRAHLARPFEKGQDKQLLNGVFLKGERAPVNAKSVTAIDEKTVDIEITEGLYHQVRRMFAAVGNHVEDLERLAIGDIVLEDSLTPSSWRLLTAEELQKLGFNRG